MASVKIYLRDERGKNTHPLYLRIYHKGRKVEKKLDIKLAEKHWDSDNQRVRKSHPDAYAINRRLTRLKAKAQLAMTDLDIVTADNIKAYLSGYNRKSFYDYWQRVQQNLNYDRRRTFASTLNILKKYRQSLTFGDITPQFLRSLQAWLLDGRKQNTVSRYLSRIRYVLRRAVEDEIIKPSGNPFATGKIKLKWEPTNPRPLRPDEFAKLVETDVPEQLQVYKDMFLFAVYCDGMRVTDVLTVRRSDITGGKLQYRMSKTGKRKRIKLVPKALEIIGKYHGDYLFPLLDSRYKGDGRKREIDRLRSRISHKLSEVAGIAGLDKLTMHMARNTFSFIAYKAGLSLPEIQHMLGHSDVSQTRRYLGRLAPESLDERRDELFGD